MDYEMQVWRTLVHMYKFQKIFVGKLFAYQHYYMEWNVSIYLRNELTRLERTQGNHIKQCLGLGKTVHSTNILQALNVRKIVNNVSAKCLVFYNSVFSNATPATKLNRFFLSRYVASGRLIPGTLISNIVRDGYSPMSVVFNKPCKYTSRINCGITESLHNLLYNETFIKPYSEEQYLVYLLTKSF